MRPSDDARFQEPTEAGIRLLVGDQRLALAGRSPEIRRHRHAAPAVIVGVDRPLRLVADRVHETRAALIAPGFSHAVDARGGRIAVFLLPAYALTNPGSGVRDLSATGSWVELGEAVSRLRLDGFDPVDRLLAREELGTRPVDERLHLAIGALAGALDENVSMAEIASAARLSPSRLMALAREQLGTSLRPYRRWLRAFDVARAYATGASLTEAALAAGFASSAHLSIAAREQFGIRPSDVLAPQHRALIRTI
jgi:AraC-like DNA-binding protein